MMLTPDRLSFFGLTGGRIFIFAALSVSAALFEGFGMAMFLPVLEFIEKGQNLQALAATGRTWQLLIEAFHRVGLEVTLFSLLGAAIVLMLMRIVAVYTRQVYSSWLSQDVLHVVRSNLFDVYMKMDYGAYTRLSSGSILNTLTTEAQRAGGSFGALFAMFSNAMVIAGLICVLLWLSVPLTLIAVLFVTVSGLVVGYYVRHTRQLSHRATGANDKYSRLVLDRLSGYRLVTLTAAGSREARRAREVSRKVRDLLYWLAKLVASVDLIMEPMVLLAGGGILYFAVAIFGMSLSEVGIFVLIMLRLLPIAKELMKSRQSFQSCEGSLNSVLSGYDLANKHQDQAGGDVPFMGVSDKIEMQEISFRYPESDHLALDRINLVIPAGKVTALVGPSGAGKTTLVDIIPRLRVPQQGKVYYDGIEGAEHSLKDLRKGMAFVSQDVAVMDDTVAENLRFASPEAAEEEIWDALKRAQADIFVSSLPQGLDTRLGERGVLLSGGQKQRLSLARALLQNTSVLILDEPTSALDSKTEMDIKRAIDELRKQGDVTIIIIAHRLSTIRNADQIVVMNNGRIVKTGDHASLMINESWYANVAGLQSQ